MSFANGPTHGVPKTQNVVFAEELAVAVEGVVGVICEEVL
jgi:hypothetical protein